MAHKRMPVTVEARFAADGTVIPLAVVEAGRRQVIAAVGRQWDEGSQSYFDVQMNAGVTTILCLERRSLQWYIVGTWGPAKMA